MKKVLIVVLLSNCFFAHSFPPIFSTLTEIQEYAQSMEEYPPNDGVAWATPLYTSYWRKNGPSWWRTFLCKIGVHSWPLWHIEGFKNLMNEITERNESNGYINRFVLKMQPPAGSVFVLWGDIQGAFHSLVRDLTKLKKMGIINDNLELIKLNTNFVFNGNFVNRGPYSLEALTVLLRLMERNPQFIFYIKGAQEDAGIGKILI